MYDNKGHRRKENGARGVQNKELTWPGGLGKANLRTGCLSGDLKTDMSELEEGGQVQLQARESWGVWEQGKGGPWKCWTFPDQVVQGLVAKGFGRLFSLE